MCRKGRKFKILNKFDAVLKLKMRVSYLNEVIKNEKKNHKSDLGLGR